MIFDEPVHALAALTLACLCIAGAVFDVKSRRLPNTLCLAAWIAGIGFAIAMNGVSAAISPLAHSLVALLVAMGLFRFGMIGGGDAKYYAGLAAWFELDRGLLLFLCVALAGAVLVIAMLVVSKVRRQARKVRRKAMSELPYGVAIACGAAASWLIAAG